MPNLEDRVHRRETQDARLSARIVAILRTSRDVLAAVVDCLTVGEDEDPGPNILEERVSAIEERLAQHPRYTTPGIDSMAFTLDEIERIRLVLQGGSKADYERLPGGK